jgi:hypothetical protein
MRALDSYHDIARHLQGVEGLTRIHKLGIRECSLRRHMAFYIKVANNDTRAY